MSKPAPPKFTQIACSVSQGLVVNGNENEKENLYALDVHGRVWWYSFPPLAEVGWKLLPDDIHEPLALPGPGPQGPTTLTGQRKK